MEEASIALIIFDKFLKIIGLIRKGDIERDEQIDEALKALYEALNETKAYVALLTDGHPSDRDKEMRIARMWHNASIPLRHIDPDLAERCFLKGSYWQDPNSWSDAQIKEGRIALDQVLESTKELLLS